MRGSDRGGICFQAMKHQRWARSALLLCLIFFFFFLFFVAERPSSGSLTRKLRHQHHRHKVDHEKPAATANEVAAHVATVHQRGCRLRKVGLLCAYPTPAEKNGSSVDDDKRIVPTGPNPLHNSEHVRPGQALLRNFNALQALHEPGFVVGGAAQPIIK